MSKWLAKFLDDMPGNSTDKPDTLLDSGTVSVMSVPIPSTSAEISGLHHNDGELIFSPPYPQQDSDGGHSEDSREKQTETPSEFLGNPLEAHTDITDTVTHILDETPRITTDKPDTLAEHSTVSVLSVPGSGIPLEISATQTDGVPLIPPPHNPQNPQNGSGVEVGPLPEPPLCPGWKVAFRNQGQLQDGIVTQCIKTGQSWTVELSKRHTIPLPWITSVGKTDTAGKVIAAWDTRAHGYDGEGMGRS